MDSNQKIIIFIRESLLSGKGDIELTAYDDLLGSGLIDSMGIMRLVEFVEDTFDKTIPPEDIVIENFMDVNSIVKYLEN